jgi:sugar (pentulose or hexulose) kinase
MHAKAGVPSTMSKFSTLAIIDIGKTNAKVVLFDVARKIEFAERRITNRVVHADPYPHYDSEGLWIFICTALAEFYQTHGFDAISITTHGASIALLDENGQLALPILDYEHSYPQDVTQAYSLIRPSFPETYSPSLSGGLNVGAQLHYQKALFPKAFANVRTILTYPQYWAFRLTGIAVNEVTSLGCHTDRTRGYIGYPRGNGTSSLGV